MDRLALFWYQPVLLLIGCSLTVHDQPIPPAAGVRVTGYQREHIPSRLDQHGVNVVRLYYTGLADFIGQRFPQVRNCDGIPNLDLVHVQEVWRAAPSAMTGDHAVRVYAANG